VFGRDALIVNVMIYIMTDSFTTGAWYYRGLVEEGGLPFQPGERVEVPTAFANFPGEPLYSPPPRTFAERAYNIVRWSEMPRGGHFAAMECPDLFVEDVRAWAREHG
jgi:pimeloyl-ACP methyl ester carboxylesterase